MFHDACASCGVLTVAGAIALVLIAETLPAAALRQFRTVDAPDSYHEPFYTNLFGVGFKAAAVGSIELGGKTLETG